MIKKLLAIAIVLIFIPVWLGCGGFPENAVAEVDGKVITREDLDARMDSYRQGSDDFPEPGTEEYNDIEKQVVEQMVSEEVIAFEAEEMDIHVTDEEIDDAIEASKEQAGGEEIYEEQLEAAGTTVDKEMQQLRIDLLFQKLLPEVVKDAPPVTDEQVLAYYNDHKSEFYDPAEMRDVRHILVDTEAEANAVLARLAAGEDFAVVATEVSLDPGSAANGGSLGSYPVVNSGLVPEFEKVMAELGAGEQSGPVQSKFGFHIIEVVSITPAGPLKPYDEVKDKLREDLKFFVNEYDFFFEWLDEAKEKYEITYADEFKPDDEETQTGTATTSTGTAEPAAAE
jgi:foldase protein PrsA